MKCLIQPRLLVCFFLASVLVYALSIPTTEDEGLALSTVDQHSEVTTLEPLGRRNPTPPNRSLYQLLIDTEGPSKTGRLDQKPYDPNNPINSIIEPLGDKPWDIAHWNRDTNFTLILVAQRRAMMLQIPGEIIEGAVRKRVGP